MENCSYLNYEIQQDKKMISADYPAALVILDFPVYGITEIIMKSAVEGVEILFSVLPIMLVNPILTVCGKAQFALSMVLLLPI
jgi:hypothetical protein